AATLYDATHSSNIGDMFLHNFVCHLVSFIFSCDKLFLHEWVNCTLESSNFYKPDRLASINPWKTNYNITIGKIKPPSKTNRGALSDFVKLVRQVKLALEDMI
ncbi:hypothetical protein K501DRAFT_130576, partial [Backusella circina FSU 941]